MKIFLEELWSWKLLEKVTVDLGFWTEKIDFCCNLLVDALVQPHFGYACSAWYPNLNNRLRSKLQTLQNKCIGFCLNLNNRTRITLIEFEKISWLTINDRFEQCIGSMAFTYFNNLSPLYMNDVFKPASQNTTATRIHVHV